MSTKHKQACTALNYIEHFPILAKLNSIKVLIYKALIDSNISHDEFILMNNVLKNMTIWKKKSKI